MSQPRAGRMMVQFLHLTSDVKNLKEQSETMFGEALGYLKTLERSLTKKSRFNNELLYQIAALTMEKLLVSLLAGNERAPPHASGFGHGD